MKTAMAKLVFIIAFAWISLAGSLAFSLAVLPAAQVSAATGAEKAEACFKGHGFFGLKPWYAYMGDEIDNTKDCNVKCFNVFKQSKPNDCGQTASDVPLVLLAIADDLLRIAALVALGFIFVGAFKYVASQGNPESTGKAQETIINALLGLAIASVAVAIVSFIGNKIGG